MKIRQLKPNMTVDGKYYRTEKKWSVTITKHINVWLQNQKCEVKPQSFFDDLVMLDKIEVEG